MHTHTYPRSASTSASRVPCARLSEEMSTLFCCDCTFYVSNRLLQHTRSPPDLVSEVFLTWHLVAESKECVRGLFPSGDSNSCSCIVIGLLAVHFSWGTRFRDGVALQPANRAMDTSSAPPDQDPFQSLLDCLARNAAELQLLERRDTAALLHTGETKRGRGGISRKV